MVRRRLGRLPPRPRRRHHDTDQPHGRLRDHRRERRLGPGRRGPQRRRPLGGLLQRGDRPGSRPDHGPRRRRQPVPPPLRPDHPDHLPAPHHPRRPARFLEPADQRRRPLSRLLVQLGGGRPEPALQPGPQDLRLRPRRPAVPAGRPQARLPQPAGRRLLQLPGDERRRPLRALHQQLRRSRPRAEAGRQPLPLRPGVGRQRGGRRRLRQHPDQRRRQVGGRGVRDPLPLVPRDRRRGRGHRGQLPPLSRRPQCRRPLCALPALRRRQQLHSGPLRPGLPDLRPDRPLGQHHQPGPRGLAPAPTAATRCSSIRSPTWSPARRTPTITGTSSCSTASRRRPPW